MKSFRQYIKEDGPSNGTGLFTYGLGFFADVVPDDFDVEAFDKYLLAEVILPKGDQMLLGKVIARKRDADDNPIGR